MIITGKSHIYNSSLNDYHTSIIRFRMIITGKSHIYNSSLNDYHTSIIRF